MKLGKVLDEIPSGACCCCGHPLGTHIDECEGWRCHVLGDDLYQCECFLRKNRYATIDGYDLKSRVEDQIKELAKMKEETQRLK